MADRDTYTIWLDGRWSLKDFYTLPHVYGQVYAFQYAFMTDAEHIDKERLTFAFGAFPWQGGYSAVNFYNVLSTQIPRQYRPKVISIRYASPGFLELGVYVAAAVSIGHIIRIFVRSGKDLHSLYNDIYKGLQERKLLRMKVRDEQLHHVAREIDFIVTSTDKLSKAMGFRDVKLLHELTSDPLASLKILMSYFRRVRTLAEYVESGKANFPDDQPK